VFASFRVKLGDAEVPSAFALCPCVRTSAGRVWANEVFRTRESDEHARLEFIRLESPRGGYLLVAVVIRGIRRLVVYLVGAVSTSVSRATTAICHPLA
jgi:hypothetical protein